MFDAIIRLLQLSDAPGVYIEYNGAKFERIAAMEIVVFLVVGALALIVLSALLNVAVDIIIPLVVAMLVGMIAGRIVRGRGYGIIGDALLGIAGGIVGRVVFGLLGISLSGIIGYVIGAVIGALIVVYLVRLLANSKFAA
jgi:uncharacterized membrane protein YeaQ/YmgE (transglycosylase-associated protein family)